jgi:hypothetical protein
VVTIRILDEFKNSFLRPLCVMLTGFWVICWALQKSYHTSTIDRTKPFLQAVLSIMDGNKPGSIISINFSTDDLGSDRDKGNERKLL